MSESELNMDQLVKAFISRSALRHNLRLLQGKAGPAAICAMIKADAYGHGAGLVVKALEGLGVAFWGVASLNEAVELRDLKVRAPILVARPLTLHEPEKTMVEQIRLMQRLRIRPSLVSGEIFRLLAKALAAPAAPLPAHLKVDTGMGRNGCAPQETLALLAQASAIKGLKLEGLYSHLACAEEKNPAGARRQLAVFNSILAEVKRAGFKIPLCHLANSAAIFNLPETRFDMVRPGKALYGYRGQYLPDAQTLRPVMRVEAPLVFTKWIGKGQTCGYGGAFRARRKTRLGLLPLGYADGYARKLSNAGRVAFQGRLAPVIGRVSMDLTMVDLTDLPEATIGSALCVISDRRAAPHSIEALASQLGTLPHEISCNLGKRVQRVLTE